MLSPAGSGEGQIILHLLSNPHATEDLAVSRLPSRQVTQPGPYRFLFAPQVNSRQQDYYVRLEYEGTGQILVGSGPGDSYLDGSLYRNDQAIDGQLSFRLVFDNFGILSGFVDQFLSTWLPLLCVSFLIYVVPGLSTLVWLWPRSVSLCIWEQLGIAGGLSIAIFALFFLITDAVGLHLGSLYAWLIIAIALLLLGWKGFLWRKGRFFAPWCDWMRSDALWPDLAAIIVLGLVVITRLMPIGSVELPMWGDSYQHTMMAQLLVDNGGLFSSWRPYADLQTFTYHFGFHAAVAVLHWVSGLALPQATLWAGQMMNILAILALYPLAIRAGGNRWAGVISMLVAGLLSSMPMFYVNWGRYTQLAGQVVLPAVVCIGWIVLEQPLNWKLQGLGWITISGLALTHYRVFLFILPFFMSFVILRVILSRKLTIPGNMFILATGSVLLFLPWFVRLFSGKLLQDTLGYVAVLRPSDVAGPAATDPITNLTQYLPLSLWLLLPLIIAWGLWRRERGAALVILWWFLALLEVNSEWLGIRGGGAITNFALFIAMYIPAGILVGLAVSWAIGSLKRIISWPVLCVVGLLALWGAWQRLGDVQIARGALATRPDLRAATWIQHNTPDDARFLVNSFFAYNGTAVVGSDGGWWLPLLAHRQTTLPPLTYTAEQGPFPDYRNWVNALTAELQRQDIDAPDIQRLLHERGITHVYIGQRQGTVNYAGMHTINPEHVLASPHFRLIYHEDRVWIFALLPDGDPTGQAESSP